MGGIRRRAIKPRSITVSDYRTRTAGRRCYAVQVLCHHCHQEDRLAATCHQIQDLG